MQRKGVNRYRGTCVECGGPVPARGGALYRAQGRFVVKHLACEEGEGVAIFQTSGGTFIQNRRGRCIDAPCCGCCTC